MPTNVSNIKVLQPQEYAQFAIVGDLAVVEFDRDLVRWPGGLGWNIDDVYTTLSSNAQPRIDRVSSTIAVIVGLLFKLRSIHDLERSE